MNFDRPGYAHSGGAGYTPTDGTGLTVPSNNIIMNVTVPANKTNMTTPSLYPSRKTLAHPPIVESSNRSIIVFLTVCTKDKTPVLACAQMHRWLLHAWSLSENWIVGRYVIMPDHVHLFCAPGKFPPTSIKKWAAYWKGLVSRATKGYGPLICPGGSGCANFGGSGYTPTDGTGVTVPSNNTGTGVTVPSNATHTNVPSNNSIWPETLWQNDCWDTQLRKGESYTAKWEYVRNNPVRAGLCISTEAWPFQGEVSPLMWHD